MADGSEIVSAGLFRVRPGQAGQFVERWSELIEWTRQHYPEMGLATLSRNDDDGDRFMSHATWSSAARRDEWRASPSYKQRSAACRELCEEYLAGDYHRVVALGAEAGPR